MYSEVESAGLTLTKTTSSFGGTTLDDTSPGERPLILCEDPGCLSRVGSRSLFDPEVNVLVFLN